MIFYIAILKSLPSSHGIMNRVARYDFAAAMPWGNLRQDGMNGFAVADLQKLSLLFESSLFAIDSVNLTDQ